MFTEEFLRGDSEAIRLSDNLKYNEDNELLCRFQRKYFNAEIKEYNLFLGEVIKLLKSLELNNSFEYSFILSLLIYGGYLSYSKEYKGVKRFELDVQLGINIVNGNGVCRHFASMHNDIFKLLNLYYEKYYCYQYNPIIPETMVANHVVSLIDYEGTLYGIDLLNRSQTYYFKNGFELCRLSALLKSKLKYKPCSDYVLTDKKYEDVLSTIKRYEDESKKRHISILELRELRSRAVEIYNNNIKLFEQFHHETKELKRDISSGVRSKALAIAKKYNVKVEDNYLDF